MIGGVEVKQIFILGYLLALVSLPFRQTSASPFRAKTLRVNPSASPGLDTGSQSARGERGDL
jgi:hypothetical protein